MTVPTQQDGLISLLRESVLVQGMLALIAIGGTFALAIAQRPIDNNIWLVDFVIVGFFFGAKSLQNVRGATTDLTAQFAETQNNLSAQNAATIQQLILALHETQPPKV